MLLEVTVIGDEVRGNSWRMNCVGSHTQIMKILGVDLYVFLAFLLCQSIGIKTTHCAVVQQHWPGGAQQEVLGLWSVPATWIMGPKSPPLPLLWHSQS